MNAWEDGNRIVADVMQFEEAPLFNHPDGRRPTPTSRGRGCAAGPSISPAIPTASRKAISTTGPANFPRIDDRRAGISSSHGWYACANPDLPTFDAFSGIVHVDGRGSRLGKYLLPAGDTHFRAGIRRARNDATEGDGWLLAAVWRARENRSDLAVFNATDVDAGPIALVQLGHRVARRLSRQLGRGGVRATSMSFRGRGQRVRASADRWLRTRNPEVISARDFRGSH